LAVILIVAKVFGILSRKFNMPEVVGQIIGGLLIGPAILGVVKESSIIDAFSEIGVIMLMFEAGLSTEITKLKKTGVKATLVASFGVIVPIIMGTILFELFYGFGGMGSDRLLEALFTGTIMSATSVSITVAALKEMGKLNGMVGTTITSAAIIDDVIGIVVLTMVISLKNAETRVGIIILKAVLFFVFAFLVGFIINYIFRILDKRSPHTRRLPISALVFCLLLSYVAERFFGIADITGAYVAGIVLCNLEDASYIERRIDISAYMVFAPVFFAGIGLKVSFGSMDLRLILFSVAFVVVAMVGKIIGCGGISKIMGLSNHDSFKIGIGMMTRGEVALITAQKGLSAGIITSRLFTPVILLILCSSILTPVFLKRAYEKYPTD
jgi:Kef-type K+ transport system membrane component KefB